MPLPQVVFTQDCSAQARSRTLRDLEQRLDSAGLSAVKTQVLRAVINFAKKNLVDAGSVVFNPLIYLSCQNILNQAHLADLLFLQYVINRLSVLRDDTSGLKRAVLPMAQTYKRALMLPLVRQMEKASFSFGVAALFMRSPAFNLPAVAEYFTSELTAEAKVEKMLNARLTWSPRPVRAARVDEDFGDGIEMIAGLVNRAGRATLGFFNRVSQPGGTFRPVLSGPNNRYQPRT